jgi:hypothetical protein
MRLLMTLMVTLVAQPCLVNGQQPAALAPKLKAPAPVIRQPSTEKQAPAVILTPIARNSQLDLSLIDDICTQNERRVQTFRLKHAPVRDVAKSLNQWLQTKLETNQADVNGFICNAPVIIVPEEATNSLIVSMANDFSHAREVEKIIQTLDRSAPTVRVQAVLKKTVNGQTTVIGKPTLVLRDNIQGGVTIGSADEQYTIELTTRVEPIRKSVKTILHSATKPGVANQAKDNQSR